MRPGRVLAAVDNGPVRSVSVRLRNRPPYPRRGRRTNETGLALRSARCPRCGTRTAPSCPDVGNPRFGRDSVVGGASHRGAAGIGGLQSGDAAPCRVRRVGDLRRWGAVRNGDHARGRVGGVSGLMWLAGITVAVGCWLAGVFTGMLWVDRW